MNRVTTVHIIAAWLWVSAGSVFSQSVTLAWDPSPAPDVVGYHLYYGTASQTYTNFVALGQTTSVTISNLSPGLIYFFAATTIDTLGLESEFSTEVAYVLGSGPCSINVSNIVQLYDGTPKPISVITTPANLPVIVTYGGLLDPPTDPGQYLFTVLSAFTQGGCFGSVSGLLTIQPGNATVQLDGLAQVYDGTPKPVQASTSPPGLNVSLTYNGLPDPPTQAGNYQVVANIVDPGYAGRTVNTLTITPAPAQIVLTNLAQTYNGSPLAASASTIPPNRPLLLTYNGNPDPPTDAGTYSLSATVVDLDYVGSTNALFVISKAPIPIQLNNLTQVYDGTPKTVSANISPSAPVLVTYNGQPAAPTNSGIYLVSASIQDNNYVGQANGTLTILKANAAVQLSGLAQNFDGTAKPVSVTTIPAGLQVLLSYSGQAQAPFAPGTYSVVATVSASNYTGSAAGVLSISLPPGLSVPIEPISAQIAAASNGLVPEVPLLLLSWPSNSAGVTIWQSSDLLDWSPVTNLPGPFNSLGIIPRPAARFFQATTTNAGAATGVPLSVRKP